MKRQTKIISKAIISGLVFCILFGIVQDCFSKFAGDMLTFRGTRTAVEGFFTLDDNSIEVLILGPSQMFCGVNAEKLTNEYGISSYDFGAPGQRLLSTYYYLQEALKHQKPKVVMVEVSSSFLPNSDITDAIMAWNYAPMPASVEKWNSFIEIFEGDKLRTIEYCFFPLLAYHSRWSTMPISKVLDEYFKEKDYSSMGYIPREAHQEVTIAYQEISPEEEKAIPVENTEYLLAISELCKKNNIQVVFFKVPVANWTKNDAHIIKAFMEKNQLEYFELNDYLDEIGIDQATDFYDEAHLNTSGANKATDFLANYLRQNFDLPAAQ